MFSKGLSFFCFLPIQYDPGVYHTLLFSGTLARKLPVKNYLLLHNVTGRFGERLGTLAPLCLPIMTLESPVSPKPK